LILERTATFRLRESSLVRTRFFCDLILGMSILVRVSDFVF
jgi:hypothetical protein